MQSGSLRKFWRRRAREEISVLASGVLVFGQVAPCYADSAAAIAAAAADGEAAAAAMAPNAATLFGKDAHGNLVLNQGSTNQATVAPAQLAPGTGAVDAASLSGAGGTIGLRTAVGATAQQALSAGTGAPSNAYSALLSSYATMAPNLSSDPMFSTTRSVISSLGSNAALFGDCRTTTTYKTTTTKTQVPDYQQCDRHLVSSENLTLTHSYSDGVIVSGGGDVAIASCGDGCLDITLGRIGDNYWVPPSGCAIYDQLGSVTVLNPAAITSAQLIRAKFDDRMQVYLNGGKIWQSSDVFPPEKTGRGVSCDLKTNWDVDPGVDVTGTLRQGGTIPFNIRVSVGGAGEGYVDLRVSYNAALLTYDSWASTADTTKALTTLQEGSVCHSSVACAAMPPLDADGCAPQAVGRVCPGWFTSPTTLAFASYVSPLCTQVQVTSSCNTAKGAMACYTDFQGKQQCYYNDGSSTDTCGALKGNPACSYVGTQCIQTDEVTGGCLVDVDTYDCGQTVAVPASTTASQAVTCTGPVQCMGTQCTSATVESNGNFAATAAKLQAIEMIRGDGACANPSDPASCAIFPGNADKCKVAVGGYVNCCNKAVSVNMADYMKMVFSLRAIDSAVMKLGTDSPVRGAWEMMTSPIDETGTLVDSAWQEAQSAFTSEANAVWASVAPNAGQLVTTASGTAIDQTATESLGEITASLTNDAAEWTYNTFGQEAANMLFSSAADAGASAFTGEGTLVEAGAQLGGMAGDLMTGIGAAYAVYSITTTLIKIIFACETAEYQLDTARQLKECHYIGSYCDSSLGVCIERQESYCCFDSPLARIMQEQARGQLGVGWGSAKSPQCEGLTVAQLNAVDWSKVDLSEWVALLVQSGLSASAATVTADSLTGSGNALSTGTAQPDSIAVSVSRLTGLDLSATMQNAKTQLQTTAGPLP